MIFTIPFFTWFCLSFAIPSFTLFLCTFWFSTLLWHHFSAVHMLIVLFCTFSINTVYYMAPFATMILAIPALLLEGNGVLEWLSTHPYPWSALIIIFSSGVLAFCLNFSIFYVIHSTTAVTFNVAGNLKVSSIRQNQMLQATTLFGLKFWVHDFVFSWFIHVLLEKLFIFSYLIPGEIVAT